MTDDARRLLRFALESYPDRVETADVGDLLLEAARRNAKRPAYLKLAVPDEVVKGLRGSRPSGRRVLLVSVPDDVEARADSPIVLPGEGER